MKGFGKNLKEIRISVGLTQKQVGNKTGYAESTVSDWEHDKTEPNLSTLKCLVDLFKINYEDLFNF